MRWIITCLLLAFAAPVAAQEAPIQKTISDQIEALKRDDFATAFGFASSSIQGIFGTPENFGRMVSEGYPMVHRPAAVKMLGLRDEGGLLWQRVMVTDAAGRAHFLDYQMVETATGWQINAVEMVQAPDIGA